MFRPGGRIPRTVINFDSLDRYAPFAEVDFPEIDFNESGQARSALSSDSSVRHTVAHEPPQPATNDTTAAPLATTSMERVAHFGPDPLPSTPHRTVALSNKKALRVYISQRDGTAWGVVRDLSEALRLSTVTHEPGAAAPGDERAIKD